MNVVERGFVFFPLALVDLNLILLKLLAVAGGAVLGGGIGGVIARRLARLAFRKETPRMLLLASRGIGCVAAGLLVWLWAFGTGGSGLGFGSGGLGSGGGKMIGYDQAREQDASQQETGRNQKQTETPGQAGASVPRPARIEMLGGSRVQEDRFYIIDAQPAPVTIDQLRKVLLAKKNQEQEPLKVIDIVIYEDSVDKDHPAVRDLEQWADRNGLQVRLSFPQGKRPRD
jgi:hypothetical protein